MRPRRKALRHDRIKLLEALEAAMKTSARERPPTLKSVADSVGVSTGCLRYHFPSEAESVIRRNKEWKGEERHRKKVEARAAVLAELANLASESNYSRKGLLRHIRRRTGLPKTLVRHEIAVALDEARNPMRSRKR
jgi:AcrR family transcriptional regulator